MIDGLVKKSETVMPAGALASAAILYPLQSGSSAGIQNVLKLAAAGGHSPE